MRFVICLLLSSLCASTSVWSADVYKWTGSDGRTHFGDRPPADAQSERTRIRSFQGQAEVAQEEMKAASIVMLSTTWCGVCKQARRYMTEKGIPFVEYDVEKSDAGRAEYKRLNGRGVPVILVGNQRMNGFSAARLEQMMKQAGLQ